VLHPSFPLPLRRRLQLVDTRHHFVRCLLLEQISHTSPKVLWIVGNNSTAQSGTLPGTF
jgi:hypothetical protein